VHQEKSKINYLAASSALHRFLQLVGKTGSALRASSLHVDMFINGGPPESDSRRPCQPARGRGRDQPWRRHQAIGCLTGKIVKRRRRLGDRPHRSAGQPRKPAVNVQVPGSLGEQNAFESPSRLVICYARAATTIGGQKMHRSPDRPSSGPTHVG